MAYVPEPKAVVNRLVDSSLLYRLKPVPTPKPVLPSKEPVYSVARPPVPTFKLPLPDSMMSPPVAVPAEVAAPALKTSALAVMLLVLMACVTDKLPSAAKLMVPPVIAMLRSTAKSLPAPVMVAETLPAPVMALAMVVSAERT